jgi:hypothetical protein
MRCNRSLFYSLFHLFFHHSSITLPSLFHHSSTPLPPLFHSFFCFLNMGGKRYVRPQKPYSATDALKRLVDKAESLSLREYLTKSEKKSLGAALTILQTETNSWKRQKYQLFLRSLQKDCGAHAVLLCAVALGQVIVANMNQQNRDRLGGILKTDTRLSGTVIRELAVVECNLPDTTQRECWFKARKSS